MFVFLSSCVFSFFFVVPLHIYYLTFVKNQKIKLKKVKKVEKKLLLNGISKEVVAKISQLLYDCNHNDATKTTKLEKTMNIINRIMRLIKSNNNNTDKTMSENDFKKYCDIMKNYASIRKEFFTILIKNPETKFGILFKTFGSGKVAKHFSKLDTDEILKIAFA